MWTGTNTGAEDEGTINVAPKNAPKHGGILKLKKPPPKIVKPGNWRDSFVEGGRYLRCVVSQHFNDASKSLILIDNRWEKARENYGKPRN